MNGWVAGFVGTWADAWTDGLRAKTDRYRAALILKTGVLPSHFV